MDRIKLPRTVLDGVRTAERNGHRLSSLGCASFRCKFCSMTDFLDVSGVSERDRCAEPARGKNPLTLECPNHPPWSELEFSQYD